MPLVARLPWRTPASLATPTMWTSTFHEVMATRTRDVDYVGATIPVISAEDLIICKALFNRPKDWLDIENIFQVREHLDAGYLRHWLNEFREPEDERIRRIDRLLQEFQRGGGPEQRV